MTEYSDRLFIIVTQVNRIGTIVSAAVENPEDEPENYVYAVEVMFGARDNYDAETLARGILETVSRRTFKPLLVAVSLLSPLDDVFNLVVGSFRSPNPVPVTA